MASDFFPPSLFLAHSCLKIATGRKLHNWSKFYVYQLSQHHTLPDVAQSHSEIPQTPSRFPRGTTIYGTFWPIQGNWEKRKQPLKMCLNGCLSIAYHTPPDSIQSHSENPRHPPDTFQTPPRQLPDTPQTPSRHPRQLDKFWLFSVLLLFSSYDCQQWWTVYNFYISLLTKLLSQTTCISNLALVISHNRYRHEIPNTLRPSSL